MGLVDLLSLLLTHYPTWCEIAGEYQGDVEEGRQRTACLLCVLLLLVCAYAEAYTAAKSLYLYCVRFCGLMLLYVIDYGCAFDGITI